MVGQLFAVIRRHGEGWVAGQPLEAQPEWDGHAAFMDAAHADGFVALAGPLGDEEALIIVRAGTREEVDTRLAADPWTGSRLLITMRVEPWTLRLGEI